MAKRDARATARGLRQTSIRLDEQDRGHIERIKGRFGAKNAADAIRYALAFAAKEAV